MAPVCVAAHLSLPTLCVFILFLTHVVHKTRLRCDHQTLLDLQPLVQNIVSFGADRQQPLLPVLLEILGYLFPRWLPGERIIVAGANKAVGWWSWRFPWGIYCFPTSAWVVPKIVGEAKMSNTRTRNWGSLGTLQPPDAFINGNIESLQQGANHWFEQD